MLLAYYISMSAEKLAVPVHNNRISPLFDVAGRFVLVNTEAPEKKFYLITSDRSDISIIEKLKDSEVSLVICSAISRKFALMLEVMGIELMPGVFGFVDEIIEAYLSNRLYVDRYAMPGCSWRKRFRGRRCPYYREIF